MGKKRVVVLMGGASSEHEVSLASGRQVAASLDSGRYEVVPVVISRAGEWCFPEGPALSLFDAARELKRRGTDCVFVALHGAFGEDGRLQGLLDLLDIPYTSSGCAASALAMDKVRSKAVAAEAGVPVANHICITAAYWRREPEAVVAEIERDIGFPCVAKSPCQGSSIGMAISSDADAFRAAIPDVFAYGDSVMVEQYIAGREVTCGVLDVDPAREPVALPVTEIRPRAAFFDYAAKYTPGGSEEITPAPLSPELTHLVQEIAVEAHRAIGCSIWSRSDFLLDGDTPVWLEINTVPGMTPTSLYPQAAAAAGIPFPQLMSLFVEAAIRHGGHGEGKDQ